MSGRELVGVDLSGGASTIGRDRDALTTGGASVAKAFAGGFTADTRSFAGRAAKPSLLETYRMNLARIQAAKAAEVTPSDVEAHALKKSRKRLARHIREGVAAPRAVALAHEHYRAKGGRSGLSAWSRKVAAG